MNKLRNLTLLERELIYKMREAGGGIREISRYVKRNPSTISRELKRNKSPRRLTFSCYYAKALYAEELADRRRHQAKFRQKLKSAKIRSYVEDQLRLQRPPRDISIRIKEDLGESISHEAIYQWVYSSRRSLIKCLARKGKRRNRANSRKRYLKKSVAKKMIIDRPSIVSTRERFGDWEGDTIISRQSNSCIFTLVERKSRFTILHKLPACDAKSALSALIESFYQIPPELRHTLTLDNGSENSCHNKLEIKTALEVYFCDAYCSWQRGSVENTNGFIRRHFPKKTDFNLVTSDQVRYVQDWLNTRRMDCLGGKEPQQVFLPELSNYPNQLKKLFPHLGNLRESFQIAA
jgi:transposase, IS30 family